jgi:hypothetical protein
MMFVEGVTQRVPNLPLSLRLKVSGCHYNSIYNNTWVSSTIKTTSHDITEILLKVVLDNINLKKLTETRHRVVLPVRFEYVVADSHALTTVLPVLFKISWLVVLMVEETGVLGENHRPVASC